jgi:hypothetical protein
MEVNMGRYKSGRDIVCNHCSTEFYRAKCFIKEGNNFCSRKCSDAGRSRDKLKQLGKTPEERAKRSEFMKQAWANGERDNDALVAWTKSDEGRAKISENVKREYREGTKEAWIKDGQFSKATEYKGIRFRSKLEAVFAWRLDIEGKVWQYEPQRFYLPDLDCVYIPDFYLVEEDKYVETKGWEKGLEKVESFRKLGYNIEIVRLKELRKYYGRFASSLA